MPVSLEITSHFLRAAADLSTDEPPGFLIQPPPRKAARGREKDTLALCLTLRARGTVSAERYGELLNLATTTFFGSPGTVTAALRLAVLAVNQRLLDLNLREGTPTQGGLIGAVLRNDDKPSAERDFYAAQCGAGALLVARSQGLERFPLETGRPLGLSNAPDLHYFHTVVNDGEYFCLTSAAPTGWTDEALAGLSRLSTLSVVGDRLRDTAGTDLTALIARFVPAQVVVAPAPQRGLTALLRSRTEASVIPMGETEAPAADTDWQDLMHRSERLGQADPTPQVPLLEEAPPLPEAEAAPDTPRPAWTKRLTQPLIHYVRSLGRAVSNTLAAGNGALRKLTARALPEGTLQKEGQLEVPNSVQLGMALLMPLIVLTIAFGVYWQQGRTREFESALGQAQTAIAQARQAPDPNTARANWQTALDRLTQAEGIRFDTNVVTLKEEAQTQLDQLDWITRLPYKPLVVGGLGRGVKITRLALLGLEVYALDATTNRILHLVPSANNTGYIQDTDFRCGSGRVGQIEIGSLVDMAVIPGPNVIGSDAVMALDGNGGLLYCAPDKEPVSSLLPLPPGPHWLPVAFELYTNRLYVLDPISNQIWQFQDTGGSYLQPPTSYFLLGQRDLKDVVEFSIASGDVYLLHRAGPVTICTRPNAGEEPLCQDTAPFTDGRPGRQAGDHLADVTQSVQLLYAPPPEPSLYLLDVDAAGIYQLSLKLAFVRQFRPQVPFPDPVETMAIDQAKRLFIGAGDNVYVTVNP